MNMQRCPNGHFFDKSKFDQCPYCNPATSSENRTIPLESTVGVPLNTEPGADWGGATGGDDIGATVPLNPNSGVTVAITPGSGTGNSSFDPVVGWFVCCDGPDKGSDFRIRSGNNSLGRGASMQIRIPNDSSVSKENMAHVAFDARTRKFFFGAGDGRNLIYVNDELLLPQQSRELNPYDRILLGKTTLLFVPLCGEEFAWE